MFRLALLLLGLVGVAGQAQAAAWTLPEGDSQLIVTNGYFSSDTYKDHRGDSQTQPTYRKYESQLYLEHGLQDGLTLGASVPVFSASQRILNQSESAMGLGDIELFARQRIFQNQDFIFSLQPLLKIPGFYNEDDPLAIGRHQFDAELRALLGGNFGEGDRHYWNMEAAYRHRMEAPGDEWRIAAALGFRVAEDWQLISEMFGTFAVDGAGGSAPILLNNTADYDLLKLQLSALYWYSPQWGLQLGANHSAYARNTGEGQTYFMAIWYRF